MAPPALKQEQQSPFLRHQLPGWQPTVPHIRYPATFGLYREGENLGLFLAPTDLRTVRRSMGLPSNDQALVLEGAQVLDGAFQVAPGPARLVSWAEIDGLEGEVDAIHLPAGLQIDPDEIMVPTPVLASPDLAVPTDLGSRVALGLNDSCHVAVISPDATLIERCLRGFIEGYLHCATHGPSAMPTLPHALVRDLISPMAPGAWHELMLHIRPRYWTLDIHQHGTEAAPIRWVCEGSGGHWRGGWAW